MVADDHDAAIATATDALARLEELDRPDLYARALDVIGTSRTGKGDERGMDDQRRAIQIARSNRAVWQMHEVFNNYMFTRGRFGYLRGMDDLLEEWRSLFDEVGGTHYSQTWFLVAEAEFSYFAGRWKHAFDSAERFLVELQRGRTDYLEPSARELRAVIGFAQGKTSTALEELDLAVAAAQRIQEPQTMVPSLCLRASLRAAMGRPTEAVADFDRLLSIDARLLGALSGSGTLPTFAWLAVDLERRSDAEVILQVDTFPRWTKAARAILAGDIAEAADLLDEIGHKPAEAYARLRAGGDHLQRALQFYESVGATRYIVQCQRALAATA
jgi:tetratricopeptide (TPR) repeat protein